ncbi:hypothetical protein [Mycolicibacterium sp. HS_4_1]
MAAKKPGMATGVEVARLSVKVSPDTKDFRSDLKRQLETIEKAMVAKIAVEPDMDGFRKKIKAETAGLKTKIKVDVDQSAVTQLSGLSKTLDSIWNSAPSAKTVGGGISAGPLVMAAAAAGLLFAAAPVVGLVTTALMALPGVVAAAATPITALTLGLDGFKKSAESIKPEFDHLKKVMSDAAQTQFSPVFQNLANTIFPTLERSLPNVTAGLAQMAQGAIDAFNRTDNAAKFENSINRISTALNDMRPGVDGFTSGFIGLIDQFTLKLPGITEWFNNSGKGFDEWVKKISGDGSLSTAFDGLGETIKTVLNLLADLGKQGIEFMGNPDNLKAFLATLRGIADSLKEIGELSGRLNNFLSLPERMAPGVKDYADLYKQNGVANEAELLAKNRQRMLELQQKASNDAMSKLMLPANMPGAPGGPPGVVDNLIDSLSKVPAAVAPAQDAVKNLANIPIPANSPIDTLLKPPDANAVAKAAEPLKAQAAEYQKFVDNITQQVRGSLSQATSGQSLPAPNFDEFKAAWTGLIAFVNSQASLITGALAAITSAVSTELGKLGGIGSAAGSALMSGLTSGMQAGEGALIAYVKTIAPKVAANKGPIPFDLKVLQPNGEALMQGLGKGMENGFQPVLDQAKDMAGRIADAFATGTDPTGNLAGFTKPEVTRMEKALAFEQKRLESQARALEYQASQAGKGAIADSLKARAKELRMQKDQFSLQKDMLNLTKEYSDVVGESSSGDNPLVKATSGLMGVPVDFAKATGKQFMSDLGISGNGFISKAVTEGISYVFNIGSVDEALSIKDRETAKNAISMLGR